MVQPKSHRWVLLGVAWLIYFSFGLIMSTIAALVTPIMADLGLTLSQMGLILGVWQLVYVPAAYPMGVVVDRIGLGRALGLGVTVVATSSLLRGFANSFEALLIAVAIFGVGGPLISTGVPKLAATLFTGRNRSLAMGIGLTAPSLGGFLALAITSSYVLPMVRDWGSVFILYGGLSFAVLIAWFAISRSMMFERREAKTGHYEKPSQHNSIWKIVRVRNVWLVVAIGFVAFLNSHGIRMWLPHVLELKGMSLAEAGYLASIPMVSGVIGVLTLPWLSSKISSIKGMLIFVLLIVGFTTYAIDITSGYLLWSILAAYGLTIAAIFPLTMIILSETPEIGPASMGVTGGIFFSVGEIGGFGGPLLMGYLGDLTGSFFTGLVTLASANLFMLTPIFLLREHKSLVNKK